MKIKNKWSLITIIGIGLFLIICFVVPFLRETYLKWRLGYIAIAPILIKEGDLPLGFSAGEIADIEPYYYQFVQAESQEILTTDGINVGDVYVYLFASRGEQYDMFERYTQVESREGIIPYEVTGLGDGQNCCPVFSLDGCDIHVVFTRCTAIGFIYLNANCVEIEQEYDFDYLVKHARRLDESLKAIACQ